MMKKPTKHGHSHTFVIDKALRRKNRFLQSIDSSDQKAVEKHIDRLSKELFDLMHSLSKK